ncbi:MAG TPA: hypothetical protein PLH72_11035 [Vicinamibacterales bacterium]|nr:hypothetical protein [Vicinamibacterales bacterium]
MTFNRSTGYRGSFAHQVDMRTAAYIVAISRVATVTKMRGMYA